MGVPHPSVPVVAQTDWLKCSEAPLSDPNFSFVLLLVPLSPPPPRGASLWGPGLLKLPHIPGPCPLPWDLQEHRKPMPSLLF